jgi:hypothetical protein
MREPHSRSGVLFNANKQAVSAQNFGGSTIFKLAEKNDDPEQSWSKF